jgi:hypothetical protein
MLTPAGLIVALVLSAPALFDAMNGSLGLAAALLRLLAAFALVAVGTAVMRKVLAPQRPHTPVGNEGAAGGGVTPAEPAGRRRDDG